MTTLYWIDGPWPGKLALAARPRGGDWLQDEMRDWREAGVRAILSLLTPEEEDELDLAGEHQEAEREGLTFLSLPIPDRGAPSSASDIAPILEKLDEVLASGHNVAIHCRQGVGRSGTLAACLLVMKGINPSSVVQVLERARGTKVPETAEQRRWIDIFATSQTRTN